MAGIELSGMSAKVVGRPRGHRRGAAREALPVRPARVVQVHVRVDEPGQHVQAAGVDLLAAAGQLRPHVHDQAAVAADVAARRALRQVDGAAPDDEIEGLRREQVGDPEAHDLDDLVERDRELDLGVVPEPLVVRLQDRVLRPLAHADHEREAEARAVGVVRGEKRAYSAGESRSRPAPACSRAECSVSSPATAALPARSGCARTSST